MFTLNIRYEYDAALSNRFVAIGTLNLCKHSILKVGKSWKEARDKVIATAQTIAHEINTQPVPMPEENIVIDV